jgi:hypothetical protein
MMTLELYKQVALIRDAPEANLYQGDVAVLADFIDHPSGGERGAILEVFNALGDSIDVVTVAASAIAPLTAGQIPAVRTRAS